jgi:hypothetical protein
MSNTTIPCSRATALRFAPFILVAAICLSGCTGPATTAQMVPLRSLVLPLPAPPKPVAVAPAPAIVKPGIHVPFDIMPRLAWCRSNPIVNRLVPMGRITKITVHHEGMDAADECSLAEVKQELRTIQRGHEQRMHAGDIGYHFIIDYNGRVWEGRDLCWQGAHAGNNDANRGNIGIVLLGNFEVQHPSEAQLAQLRQLLDYLMARYNIAPDRVYTHREIKKAFGLAGTECPGRYLQSEMNSMRRRLAQAGK